MTYQLDLPGKPAGATDQELDSDSSNQVSLSQHFPFSLQGFQSEASSRSLTTYPDALWPSVVSHLKALSIQTWIWEHVLKRLSCISCQFAEFPLESQKNAAQRFSRALVLHQTSKQSLMCEIPEVHLLYINKKPGTRSHANLCMASSTFAHNFAGNYPRVKIKTWSLALYLFPAPSARYNIESILTKVYTQSISISSPLFFSKEDSSMILCFCDSLVPLGS